MHCPAHLFPKLCYIYNNKTIFSTDLHRIQNFQVWLSFLCQREFHIHGSIIGSKYTPKAKTTPHWFVIKTVYNWGTSFHLFPGLSPPLQIMLDWMEWIDKNLPRRKKEKYLSVSDYQVGDDNRGALDDNFREASNTWFSYRHESVKW